MSIIAYCWASSPALCYYGNGGACVVYIVCATFPNCRDPPPGPEDPKIKRLVQQKAHLVIKAYFAQHGECTTIEDLEKLKCVLHKHGYRQ